MKTIFPEKLKKGDLVRVVSPAQSLSMTGKKEIKLAKKRFEDLGLKIEFSKNVFKIDDFNSSGIKERVKDLEDAFLDERVKMILCADGGFNSNQLLEYLDYGKIRKNPKIFMGYSDITVLLNAIYAKTSLITFCGPMFSSFGMKKGFEYSLKSFRSIFFYDWETLKINPSNYWSDDDWMKDQDKRRFYKNKGVWIINKGKAFGKALGGNLCSFNLFQGTDFMPNLKNSILFIEDDNIMGKYFIYEFDRNLESLIQQKDFKGVKGIVFGRFEKNTGMTKEVLKKIVLGKRKLRNIPIFANYDFGHTFPQFIFPIGLKVEVDMIGNVKIISM